MARMSNKAFSRLANAGGASRVLRGRSKAEVDAGYAVSVEGSETKTRRATPQIVARHAQRIAKRPEAVANPDAMQGGWRSGGQTYLDLSNVFTDRREAAGAMHSNHQQAMYDFAHDRDIVAKPLKGAAGLGYGGTAEMGYDKFGKD